MRRLLQHIDSQVEGAAEIEAAAALLLPLQLGDVPVLEVPADAGGETLKAQGEARSRESRELKA